MYTLGWRILLLVAAASSLPDPTSIATSEAHSRHGRQVDTSNLSDAELLCKLSAAIDGNNKNCDQNQPPAPNPNSELIEGSCSCAPIWQCKDNNVPAELTTDTESFLALVSVRTSFGCPKPEETCCFNIDTTLKPKMPSFSPSCGKRNHNGIITNFVGFQEKQSQFGEFPWMAAIMTSKVFGINAAPLYICGGSLIHSRVILTAAHYMTGKNPAELLVRLGEWNFKEQSESLPHKDYRVQEVLVDPSYISSTLANDVALLILEQPAQLGHTIDTICLPPPNYNFNNHDCVVSGWGKDVFSEVGKYQQILKSIELPIVDHSSCELAMRGTRLGTSFHLHDSFICAGGEKGVDACEGDGGSPLVCFKPGDPSTYYQAGVVSWGIGCGKDGLPGVYASISQAVPWINSIIADKFGHDVRIGGK